MEMKPLNKENFAIARHNVEELFNSYLRLTPGYGITLSVVDFIPKIEVGKFNGKVSSFDIRCNPDRLTSRKTIPTELSEIIGDGGLKQLLNYANYYESNGLPRSDVDTTLEHLTRQVFANGVTGLTENAQFCMEEENEFLVKTRKRSYTLKVKEDLDIKALYDGRDIDLVDVFECDGLYELIRSDEIEDLIVIRKSDCDAILASRASDILTQKHGDVLPKEVTIKLEAVVSKYGHGMVFNAISDMAPDCTIPATIEESKMAANMMPVAKDEVTIEGFIPAKEIVGPFSSISSPSSISEPWIVTTSLPLHKKFDLVSMVSKYADKSMLSESLMLDVKGIDYAILEITDGDTVVHVKVEVPQSSVLMGDDASGNGNVVLSCNASIVIDNDAEHYISAVRLGHKNVLGKSLRFSLEFIGIWNAESGTIEVTVPAVVRGPQVYKRLEEYTFLGREVERLDVKIVGYIPRFNLTTKCPS